MIKFNEKGYIEGQPVKPDRWTSILPEMPAGRIITDNTVPPGFLIIQNFVTAAFCNDVVKECEKLGGERHTVSDSADAKSVKESEARRSEFIDVRALGLDIVGTVRQIFTNVVGPHFRSEIEWFELPEILRYRSGGEYKPHADADSWFPSEGAWKRTIDRDLSILLYLNEGFQGGEIDFPNFGFKLQPKRGLLIAFPSDCRYVHAARPVSSGIRYAVVSWAAVKGGERVGDGPRPYAIRL